MKNNLRYAGGTVLAASLIGGVAYWTLYTSPGKAESNPVAEPSSKVALAQALSEPYTFYVEGIGKIEATQQTALSTETSGRIEHILFDSGDVVKRDQVLVRINDAPEQADLIRLRAQVALTRAQWDRAQELVRSGSTSQRAFEDARANFDAAKGDLEKTQANIDQKTIRAPFAGTLGIRLVHLGQYLQSGTPIATLTGRHGTRVNFTLSETEASKLRIGLPVTAVTDAYPDQAFRGKITAIDPQLSDAHIITAQAVLDDTGMELRPGMYARVRVAAEVRDEITIPESAITYNSYGPTVFRTYPDGKDRTRVKRANIKVGERRDGRVIVTSGLKSGEMVVTSGQLRLADGALIDRVPDTISLTNSGSVAR